MLSFCVSAQESKGADDYFTGKWFVQVPNVPGGDLAMTIDLKRVDGKLTGEVIDKKKVGVVFKITKLEEKANSVTVYFMSNSMEVYIYLEKNDEKNVTANLIDMFEGTGVRVVDEK